MASHLEMKNRSSHPPPMQASSKPTMASAGSAVMGHGQYGSGTLWGLEGSVLGPCGLASSLPILDPI